MIVRELFAKLGLQVDQNAFGAAESMLARLRGGFVAFGAAAVSGMAAAALGIAKTTANAGDQVRKLSQRTGVESGALQEFMHAADLADVSTESLAKGMQFLAKSGVKDVRGEMLRLAEQMAGMPNDGARVELAMRKLGKGGAALIPMFAGGRKELATASAEALQLGLILSEEDQVAAELFNDELTRLGKTFVGFRNRIGMLLIRPLTQAVTAFRTWVAEIMKFSPRTLEAGLKALGIAFTTAGVLAVGAAFKAVAAWTIAGAPILIVIAALTLLGLVLEDVYMFFTDGKSVIGDFSGYVKREFGSWREFFYSLLKWLGTLFDDFWDGVKVKAQSVWDYIKENSIGGKFVVEASEFLSRKPTPPGGAVSDAFGGGSSPAASAMAGVNVSKMPVINAPQFRADITVNAAPGMSAQGVAEQVKLASDDWWNGKMREASAGVE